MLAIEVTDSERSLRMQLGVELTGAENSCRVRSLNRGCCGPRERCHAAVACQ